VVKGYSPVNTVLPLALVVWMLICRSMEKGYTSLKSMMQPESDWKQAESSFNKMFLGNRKTVPLGAVFFYAIPFEEGFKLRV
jgi:hypothetical protein